MKDSVEAVQIETSCGAFIKWPIEGAVFSNFFRGLLQQGILNKEPYKIIAFTMHHSCSTDFQFVLHPVTSSDLEKNGVGKWDSTFISTLSVAERNELALGAHLLGVQPLVDLCVIMIASSLNSASRTEIEQELYG